MDKKIEKIAREAIEQARSEGMDEADQKWMAAGAINRYARESGREITEELNAASIAAARHVQKGGKSEQ